MAHATRLRCDGTCLEPLLVAAVKAFGVPLTGTPVCQVTAACRYRVAAECAGGAMSDRLALADAIEDAGISRDKATRIASVIFDAIHQNVTIKTNV
jgi:hypothetical protein